MIISFFRAIGKEKILAKPIIKISTTSPNMLNRPEKINVIEPVLLFRKNIKRKINTLAILFPDLLGLFVYV